MSDVTILGALPSQMPGIRLGDSKQTSGGTTPSLTSNGHLSCHNTFLNLLPSSYLIRFPDYPVQATHLHGGNN